MIQIFVVCRVGDWGGHGAEGHPYKLLLMDRRGVGVWDEAHAAACLVLVRGADGDAFLGFKGALRIVSGLATLHTDSVSFGDVFGDCQQLWHRFPWLDGVVLIETGNDHAHAALSEGVGDVDQFVIKKLSLIDADDFRVRIDFGKDLGRRTAVSRFMTHLGVGNNLAL